MPAPKYFRENRSFAHWVQGIRGEQRQLTFEQLKKLDEIGFDWNSYSRRRWERQYEKLALYIKQHGCFPSRTNGQRGMEHWLESQRKHKRDLTLEQRKKLKAIGFSLDPKAERWEQRYRELARFHKRFGHCNVPSHNPQFSCLRAWLHHQRVRASSMSTHRRERLDALGVDWTILPSVAERSEQYLERLEQFFSEHGHCQLSSSCKGKNFLQWFYRVRCDKDQLPTATVRRLEAIGIIWHQRIKRHDIIDERFKELAALRDKHGHCRVSKSDSTKLYKWVQMKNTITTLENLPQNIRNALTNWGLIGATGAVRTKT